MDFLLQPAIFCLVAILTPVLILVIVLNKRHPAANILRFSLTEFSTSTIASAISLPISSFCFPWFAITLMFTDFHAAKEFPSSTVTLGDSIKTIAAATAVCLVAAVTASVCFISVIFYVRKPSILHYLTERWFCKVRTFAALFLIMGQLCLIVAALLLTGMLVADILRWPHGWVFSLSIGMLATLRAFSGGLSALICVDIFALFLLFISTGLGLFLVYDHLSVTEMNLQEFFEIRGPQETHGSTSKSNAVETFAAIAGLWIVSTFLLCCSPPAAQRICAHRSQRWSQRLLLLSIPVMLLCSISRSVVTSVFSVICQLKNADASKSLTESKPLLLLMVQESSSTHWTLKTVRTIFGSTLSTISLSFVVSQLHSLSVLLCQELIVLKAHSTSPRQYGYHSNTGSYNSQISNYTITSKYSVLGVGGNIAPMGDRISSVRITTLFFGVLCIAAACILLNVSFGFDTENGFLTIADGLTLLRTILYGVAGPIVGLFCLGILFPFANKFGAILGLLVGTAVATGFSTIYLLSGEKVHDNATSTNQIPNIGLLSPQALSEPSSVLIEIRDSANHPLKPEEYVFPSLHSPAPSEPSSTTTTTHATPEYPHNSFTSKESHENIADEDYYYESEEADRSHDVAQYSHEREQMNDRTINEVPNFGDHHYEGKEETERAAVDSLIDGSHPKLTNASHNTLLTLLADANDKFSNWKLETTTATATTSILSSTQKPDSNAVRSISSPDELLLGNNCSNVASTSDRNCTNQRISSPEPKYEPTASALIFSNFYFLTPSLIALISFALTVLMGLAVSVLTGGTKAYALDWHLICVHSRNMPDVISPRRLLLRILCCCCWNNPRTLYRSPKLDQSECSSSSSRGSYIDRTNYEVSGWVIKRRHSGTFSCYHNYRGNYCAVQKFKIPATLRRAKGKCILPDLAFYNPRVAQLQKESII